MKLCKLADKLMLLDDAFSTFILKTSYPEVSWSCCSQKPDPLFTTFLHILFDSNCIHFIKTLILIFMISNCWSSYSRRDLSSLKRTQTVQQRWQQICSKMKTLSEIQDYCKVSRLILINKYLIKYEIISPEQESYKH